MWADGTDPDIRVDATPVHAAEAAPELVAVQAPVGEQGKKSFGEFRIFGERFDRRTDRFFDAEPDKLRGRSTQVTDPRRACVGDDHRVVGGGDDPFKDVELPGVARLDVVRCGDKRKPFRPFRHVPLPGPQALSQILGFSGPGIKMGTRIPRRERSRGRATGSDTAGTTVGVDEVRAIASLLPRSYEVLVRDRVKFRVGSYVYLSLSRDETVMGFAFPKEEREGLVASEPDKFMMPSASDMRYHWVHVNLSALDLRELREIVIEAWRMVVPKKVADSIDERALLGT